MALTPESDDSFAREVDEDLRRDRLNSLWQRYGRGLIVAISLGLIGFGGYLYWKETQKQDSRRSAEAFAAALGFVGRGEVSKAEPLLTSLAADAPAGYSALARLAQAGTAVENGELDKALTQLDALAADQRAPAVMRELAAFRAVSLRFDTMKPADAEVALKPLAQEGKPFFAPAAELLAISYIDQGKAAQARPLLEAVAGLETAPPSLRGRAANLVQVLPEAPADTVPKAAPAPAPAPAPEKE